MKVFVCGGGYFKGYDANPRYQFGIVQPTEGLPYVERTQQMANALFHLCKHHSHLYSVNTDTGVATMESKGMVDDGEGRVFPPERIVTAPKTITLTPEQLSQVRQQVTNFGWL